MNKRLPKPIEDETLQSITLIQKINKPSLKILFLGYHRGETRIIDKLIEANCEVWHSDKQIIQPKNFDLIISFGYRHLINKNIIAQFTNKIINLHISYLPWNRGAHPIFWSFYENTPSGVSIHIIDSGIDTGPVLLQKIAILDSKNLTFFQAHQILIEEIESLFIENIDDLLNGKITPIQQKFIGSYHNLADLPPILAVGRRTSKMKYLD